MIKLLKQIFCKHEPTFVRNIYGDEIRYMGWKRSIWRCSKCDTEILKDELHSEVRK